MTEKRRFADGREQNPGGRRRTQMAWAGGKAPRVLQGLRTRWGTSPGHHRTTASLGAVGSGTAERPQGWSRGGQGRGGAWVTVRPRTLHTHPERGRFTCT